MKITANKKKQIFIIEKNGFKYRTLRYDKQTFEDMQYWTNEDWNYYLRSTNEYFNF